MNPDGKVARVLLADDHAEFLTQTGEVLAGEFVIVGSVTSGADLIRATAQLDPDVVVLDITMPGLDGIEVARQLKQSGYRGKLVFLTVHEDGDYVRAAFRSGGTAYVTKARLASDLIIAVHAALAGNTFVSPTVSIEEIHQS